VPHTRAPILALCVLASAAGTVLAGDLDPFRDADAVHETGLARLADEAGDGVLRSVLEGAGTEKSSRERVLMAIRAAPFAGAPERLIPVLIPLACGRDPNLAPEAGFALASIGARMRPSELSAREVLLSELDEASRALAGAKDQRGVRADIVAELGSLAGDLVMLQGSLGASR
jgi:hypothetical protein